ncbi:MAG: dihydroorotate oxidase electron transfer subunit [Microbacteriaceae bacterium]|nr:MAG: dihydroorotate oxidase electron transfer subunit [Microbacteriaceae bacterium]
MSANSSDTHTSGLEGLIKLRLPRTSPAPKPTWDRAPILAHRPIGDRYHRLTLRAPTVSNAAEAGQFVMATIGEGEVIVLPRPMAIHRRRPDRGEIDIVFSVTGRGTQALANMSAGDYVDLIGPLGRGFEIATGASRLLLIGRGIGVGAVMTAAEDARQRHVMVSAVLSAARHESVIGLDDCAELGVAALPVADEDGSSTVEELETSLTRMHDETPPDIIMVCGSTRLVTLSVRLAKRWGASVQVSVEEHMACGLGYCHGCAAPVPTDPDREGPMVCVDGPVFDACIQRVPA